MSGFKVTSTLMSDTHTAWLLIIIHNVRLSLSHTHLRKQTAPQTFLFLINRTQTRPTFVFTLFGHPCRIALTNPLTEMSPPPPTLSLAVARGAVVGDLAGFSSESPTRLPALCPCRSRRRAPCWGFAVDAARCSARSAGRPACPYLCYRLLVPHGRLFDQV